MTETHLQLVDLAGTEKFSKNENDMMSKKESLKINRSLFALKQCMTLMSSKE